MRTPRVLSSMGRFKDRTSVSNRAPTVTLTPDFQVEQGNTIDVFAVTADPDLDPVTNVNTLTTKPGGSAAALTAVTSLHAQVNIDIAGTYVVTATATDDGGAARGLSGPALSSTTTCTITGITPAVGPVLTADQSATSRTQALFAYLRGLMTVSTNRVVSGELVGGPGYDSLTNFNACFTDTGHYPGLMGVDYGTGTQSQTSINTKLSNHDAAGGMVTASSVVLNNPQTLGTNLDRNCNINTLLTPGSASYNQLRTYLDNFATGLSSLRDANIPVLFRPYAEMNSSSWWWTYSNTTGTMTAANYKELWRQTFDYLVTTKGLHNLLFLYAPYMRFDHNPEDFYPGDAYVDAVGFSNYAGASLSSTVRDQAIAWFATHAGKIHCMSETGRQTGTGSSNYDLTHQRNLYRDYFTDLAFYMQWYGQHSHHQLLNDTVMINDAITRNRDEVSF